MLPKSELPVSIKGVSPELRQEVEQEIEEFERIHEAAASSGGRGYVAKITMFDYAVAGIVSVLLTIYFILAVFIL